MSKFKLNPLSIALLGAIATPTFAETTTENKNHQLSTIVVSAAGYEQKITDAPASITVITEDQLKTKRITSIADALKDVEGIDISPSAGKTGGLNIRMRGMASEYTLVLIDGKRQNSTGDLTPNGFGETKNNFIPPVSAIERIEVIRGPMSTLYGSDAMGGVINIITKKVSDVWTGSLGLEGTIQPNSSPFGNQGAVNLFATGPLIKDKLGIQLRARHWTREQSDIVKPLANGTTKDVEQGNNPTKADLTNLGARLTFTPNQDHEISFDADITEQNYDNSKGQLGINTVAGGYTNEQTYERSKFYVNHAWKNSFGRLESSLSYNETETIGRLIPSRAQQMSNESNPREIKSEDIIFDTKFTTQLFDNHNLTIGGQWWDASINDTLRSIPKAEFTQLGLFVEDTWDISDTLHLTLGGRFDDHNSFGDFFTPRAYLVWNAHQQWTIKGGYSEGYKVPRLEQLTMGFYSVSSQGKTPSLGNPDLKPETSQNAELGIYFDSLAGFKANITYFQNRTEDKITTSGAPYALLYGTNTTGVPVEFDCTGNASDCDTKLEEWGVSWSTQNNDTLRLARPYNASKAKAQGIELGLSYDLNDAWNFAANYTWTDGEITDPQGKTIEDTENPKHMANLSVIYKPADNVNLWLRGEYRSSQFRSNAVVRNAIGDYKSYDQWHLGSNFTINNNWDVGVALYNIFDKNFIDYKLVDNEYYNSHLNTQEGRRVQLSTTFKF
ncbi:TonB-dependent receptor [Acinetobacter portensis]|uniref:TonB-dependent receptor n=1 Tax=Acinetobacter portensis TaxID=1839785 RepID=A0ABY4JTZ6_9GAMM|nr:TonB-dependent receptor [Acinetobacter portensis]MCK7608544.1 TonB-dependent receptor [Acinetobacter portensis]MCK7639358.1 TonB-dependent receptor [Acinetobacter portensis]UPO22915.1 TonB-dependent receptor [Acinetobacter portensis]